MIGTYPPVRSFSSTHTSAEPEKRQAFIHLTPPRSRRLRKRTSRPPAPWLEGGRDAPTFFFSGIRVTGPALQVSPALAVGAALAPRQRRPTGADRWAVMSLPCAMPRDAWRRLRRPCCRGTNEVCWVTSGTAILHPENSTGARGAQSRSCADPAVGIADLQFQEVTLRDGAKTVRR